MKNFLRALKYTLKYRKSLGLSIFCASWLPRFGG